MRVSTRRLQTLAFACAWSLVLAPMVGCGQPNDTTPPTGDDDDDIGTDSGNTTNSGTQSNDASSTDHTSNSTSSSNDDICDSEMVIGEIVPPNVMLVLDKSGSMMEKWLDGDKTVSRWNSLYNTVKFIVETYGAGTNFGAKLFPAFEATETAPNDCLVDPGIEVPVAPNNGAAILAALPGENATVAGNTPTLTGLELAYEALLPLALGASADPNPEAIVLITDGRVKCDQTDQALRDQARVAYEDANIPVYVIGVDIKDDTDEPTLPADLDALAAAGGTTSAVLSDKGADLKQALDKIVGRIATCELNLPRPPERWNFLRLTVDGKDYIATTPNLVTCAEAQALNPNRGVFIYKNAQFTTVELCGDGCDGFKKTGDAQIEFLCLPPE